MPDVACGIVGKNTVPWLKNQWGLKLGSKAMAWSQGLELTDTPDFTQGFLREMLAGIYGCEVPREAPSATAGQGC